MLIYEFLLKNLSFYDFFARQFAILHGKNDRYRGLT